ncbi:hypothetical protein [Pseudolysinimonas sp.]|uniref:hypothetical protein n=1 Tax=Pseudolysinimonas sp. TaxID=2680009 RepID=UPI003F7FDAB2
MSAVLTIHYQSPADDEFKVPRPHRWYADTKVTDGGEIGRVTLLGFSVTSTPDVDNWDVLTPEEAVEVLEHEGDDLHGYFAQFSDAEGMFGYRAPIDRVEVEHR